MLWRWGTEPWTVVWSVFTDSKTGCSVVRVPIVVASVYPSTASGVIQCLDRYGTQSDELDCRRTEQSVRRQQSRSNGLHPPVWKSAHSSWDRIKMSTLDHHNRNRPRPQRRPTPSLSVGNAATHPPAKQDGSPLTQSVGRRARHQAVSSRSTAPAPPNQPAIHSPTAPYRAVPYVRGFSQFSPITHHDDSFWYRPPAAVQTALGGRQAKSNSWQRSKPASP